MLTQHRHSTVRRCLRRPPREPEKDQSTSPVNEAEQSRTDRDPIRCRNCGHAITDGSTAVSVSSAHHHTFANPAGILYEIACYDSAPGCLDHGHPSSEFSWFPGFEWSYALCRGCGSHLGWWFSAFDGRSFWGLIFNRLVES